MLFVSFKFFAFVFAAIALYYLCPIKYRWVILLLSSCCFYIFITKRSFIIAILSIIITYIASFFLNHQNKKIQKFSLISSIILLLIILTTFKYTPDIYSVSSLMVPLGISYYTLSLIGYLVDVYYKKQEAEKNFLKLTLYTLYFPKIVQGPITSFKDLGPKIIKGNKFNYDNMYFGMQRIFYGYFKKLVISQRISLLTSNIFDGNIMDYSAGGAVLLISSFIGLFSFYCDFSGYMDIVIGVSQMFGVELNENFRQPFFSKTISEFWRRWHITLGSFFREYVYIPLGGNRVKLSRWIFNIMIVWFLTGIWHEFNINYILWGIYYSTIIIVSHVFDDQLKNIPNLLHLNTKKTYYKVFQIVRTIIIKAFGYLLSSLVGYKQMKQYLLIVINDFQLKMLLPGTFKSLGLDYTNLIILIISIAVVLLVDLKARKDYIHTYITKLNPIIRWIIYALLIIAVVIFGLYGPGYDVKDFEYMRF